MVNMQREQAIAAGALCLLLFVCVVLLGFSFKVRFDAASGLSDMRKAFARLESQSQSSIGSRNQTPAVAPDRAFLSARTQGLASAELLSYLARLAASQDAVLISSGNELTRQNSPDVIHIQAIMEIRLKALQAVLFQLETGTPYVFTESLTMTPVSAGPGAVGIQDPSLRVTLVLRVLWRREPA
jgi:general secretion pathway protein M